MPVSAVSIMVGPSTRPASHCCVAARICVALAVKDCPSAASGRLWTPLSSAYWSHSPPELSTKGLGSMLLPGPAHVSGCVLALTYGPSGTVDVATPTHSRPPPFEVLFESAV